MRRALHDKRPFWIWAARQSCASTVRPHDKLVPTRAGRTTKPLWLHYAAIGPTSSNSKNNIQYLNFQSRYHTHPIKTTRARARAGRCYTSIFNLPVSFIFFLATHIESRRLFLIAAPLPTNVPTDSPQTASAAYQKVLPKTSPLFMFLQKGTVNYNYTVISS